MSTGFVAGSRQISRLPAEVRTRLDTMVEKGFQIFVGDANGADSAVQQYFAARSYRNVVVHCMKDHCRNNVGNWPTRQLVAPRGGRDFVYYSVKDRAMAEAAEYGLMLWDGKSKGTVNNVVNLSRDHKPIVVCIAPKENVTRSRPWMISNVFSRPLRIDSEGDTVAKRRQINEAIVRCNHSSNPLSCLAALFERNRDGHIKQFRYPENGRRADATVSLA